jgi:hypothetical protein
MWLTTTRGHFSTVKNQDDGESLLVRARARADLEALTELPPMQRYSDQIVETPEADYPFRIWSVNPVSFAAAVSEMIREEIDYAAFKTAVAEDDPERARTYMDAWFAFLSIEQEGREDEDGDFDLGRPFYPVSFRGGGR